MDKVKLLFVAGIRSHYIKTFAVQSIYPQLPEDLQSAFSLIYVNTGQHYDYELAGGFINRLNVHFDKTISYKTKSSYEIAGQMFPKLNTIIDDFNKDEKIDYIVVFGDVLTTMVASTLAAMKCIPLIHIEAGARSGKERGPEEGFRVLADHLSEVLFVSSKQHMQYLYNEALNMNAFFSGDIIYDIVLREKEKISDMNFSMMIDGAMKVNRKTNYILASLHHIENANLEMLKKVFDSFRAVDGQIYFIAHPRIKKIISDMNFDKEKIIVLDYISYLDNLKAMKGSKYIVTDSGGMQREAYYLGRRCLVRQGRAFWQALIDCGMNKLMGSTTKEMIKTIKWMEIHCNENNFPVQQGEFGSGKAVETVFETILNYHKKKLGEM